MLMTTYGETDLKWIHMMQFKQILVQVIARLLELMLIQIYVAMWRNYAPLV